MKRNRILLFSLLFLGVIITLAAFAPWVTRFSYDEQNIAEKLESASRTHWMGTDTLGRDLYSRIVYGARLSLAVGVSTALVSLTIGTLAGAIAGYRGGWVDRLIMRIADVIYILPSILIAILLTVVINVVNRQFSIGYFHFRLWLKKTANCR